VNAKKILIADDEPDILTFIQYNLEKEGYTVFTATDGNAAFDIAKKETPQLIILDVMMPNKNGIQTCEMLRANSQFDNSIIIFLTALIDDDIQVKGLELGADDYIAKPISPKVLVSKVNALLRRSKIEEITVTDSEIIINKEAYTVTLNNEQIVLPKKEFELLVLLNSKPGKVFLRQEILDKVWGSDVIVGDRTIDVHVRKIRAKLGIDCIKTIKGVGYKYEL
jgi:two-component system, OmpR family, alkaline phosphatase synthesis response regulator PhoP